MTFKLISLSFCICIVITFIFSNVFRPNSSVFLPSIMLQLVGFIIMALCVFMFRKFQFNYKALTYMLSFFLSYLLLLFTLWRINTGDFYTVIVKAHAGKDFMSLLFPYIISNSLAFLYILLWRR